MKKILAVLLALTMILAFASCGGNNNANSENGTSSAETVTSQTALEVMNKLWASYTKEDKIITYTEVIEEEGQEPKEETYEVPIYLEPGEYSVEDAEALDGALGFPAASVSKIKNAAYLLHARNANSFTCGAFQLNNASDAQAVANEIKENIMNRQWMCGFPERLYIVSVGDVVVSAFGLAGFSDVEADFMKTFVDRVGTLDGVKVLIDTPIEVQ